MQYGYGRVSTREQNEQRQLAALREFGISDAQIYIDKQSGKDFERPNYKKMIRKLKCGDTVVIKSIDRLGRNYDEILEQWRYITKVKQAVENLQIELNPLKDLNFLAFSSERKIYSENVWEILKQYIIT